MSATPLRLAQIVVTSATVATGWYVVADQALSDGWVGGGTGWLALLAALATLGAVVALRVAPGPSMRTALGFALVVAAPTGFWYAGNLAVLLLAAVELARLGRARRTA